MLLLKVQLLESLSADCDTEIITWTMNSVDDQQGRLQAVSLGNHKCW